MFRVFARRTLPWLVIAGCAPEPIEATQGESAGVEGLRERHHESRGHRRHRRHRADRLPCPRGSHLIVGTEGPDNLVGTRGRDCILGLDGNDRIDGRSGDDVLIGGDGDDFMEGGSGRDLIVGGDGNDQIAGDSGNDRIRGGDGNDIVRGGAGDDRVFGGPGNDLLMGDADFDRLFGGRGDDAIVDAAGGAEVRGGPGIDYCVGDGCERTPIDLETGCDPILPGETCEIFPCCIALGMRIACSEDADCDDANECTRDSCQPAAGCVFAVDPNCAACPIGWQPSVMTPVFWGERDYDTVAGAPGPVRVFFPSLDGSPPTAPILLGCGRYPLILFSHGHCNETDHYRRWSQIPEFLARSGYVVVVPDLPNTRGGAAPESAPNSDVQLIGDTLTWMRTTWDYAGSLLPDSIGIVGHSNGALLAGRFARENEGTPNAISAYASLSGVWPDWNAQPAPIHELEIPKLFTWGVYDGYDFPETDAHANLDTGDFWSRIPTPKHRVTIPNAQHFDYLRSSGSACFVEGAPCPWTESLARELTATFFSKYLPPEHWSSLESSLPDTLLLPPLMPTDFDQEFFMGGFRVAQDNFEASDACTADLAWQAASEGSATIP